MILKQILEKKKLRLAEQLRKTNVEPVRQAAIEYRNTAEKFRLSTSLRNAGSVNIIAEIKRASPSKGIINEDMNVADQALNYARGGACGISVLTEEDHFKGSLADLTAVRNTVDLPILRKDFVTDKFHIYEAAAFKADAVLLIAAALSDDELAEFKSIAEDELGMDALIEVHTEEEFERVLNIGAKLIGINNRDLKTFNVSLDISKSLIGKKPAGSLMISESGITKRAEIDELISLGFDGLLIGETLMRSNDAAEVLMEFRI